jgi:hypothetical protein
VRVAEIWRFPVKSMGGERLPRAELGLEGALKLGQRRVMTTYHPDTLEQDVGVLRGIQREIAEGDRVELES